MPYFLSFIAFVWGIWQFTINQRNKKKESRYQAYSKVSGLINSFDYAFDKFFLSISINDFRIIKEKSNVLKSLLTEIQNNVNEIKKSEIQAAMMTSLVAALNKQNDLDTLKKEGYQILADYHNLNKRIKEQITVNKKNLQKWKLIEKDIENEEINLLEKMKSDFFELSLKLDEFIMSFNQIDDINIISSKKAIGQITQLKKSSFDLKKYFDKLHGQTLDYIDMCDLFLRSNEWNTFYTAKQELLEFLRKEI